MDKDYKRVVKKVNDWIKKNDIKSIRKVSRPNPYPWHFWSAKWSTYGAVAFLKLGLKPNHVTYLWFFIGIIASLFLWPGTLLYYVIFIVLYNLTWYLDFVDGDMARIINHVSPSYKQNVTAAWLDKFAYSTHKSLVLLGMGVGLFYLSGELPTLLAGFAASYILILDNLMKVRVTETLAKKSKLKELNKPISFVGNKSFVKEYLIPIIRPEPISILTLALIFGFTEILLYFYLLMYFVYIVNSYLKITESLSKVYR